MRLSVRLVSRSPDLSGRRQAYPIFIESFLVPHVRRYYKFLDEDVPAFEPDIRIDPNWKDFKDGTDAVMEWIISYCKK